MFALDAFFKLGFSLGLLVGIGCTALMVVLLFLWIVR